MKIDPPMFRSLVEVPVFYSICVNRQNMKLECKVSFNVDDKTHSNCGVQLPRSGLTNIKNRPSSAARMREWKKSKHGVNRYRRLLGGLS